MWQLDVYRSAILRRETNTFEGQLFRPVFFFFLRYCQLAYVICNTALA